MPTFQRIAADQKVEAICITEPTTVDTPYGKLTASKQTWVIKDYKGRSEILSYQEFKDKYDPFDQEAIDYLNTWKQAPLLTNIEPTSGAIGSTVYISGDFFNAVQGTGKVYFGVVNVKEATVTSWSMKLIVVTVPTGLPTAYPVNVYVVVGSKQSNSIMFQVTI